MKKGEKHIKWTEEEISFLKDNYPDKGKHWCIGMLNKSEGQVRSRAAKLGLRLNQDSEFWNNFQNRAAQSKVGKKRPMQSAIMKGKAMRGEMWVQNKVWTEEERKVFSDRAKKYIKENGHPRGMLGKHHSEKMKKQMSKRLRVEWADQSSAFNSKSFRQGLSDRQSKAMTKRVKNKGSIYSRANVGWYKIAGVRGRHYFRSGWEVVYACHLQWLKNNGKIKKWEYEPDTFWFKEIKRGVRSYTPDFKIYNWTGTTEYIEVKGYMDDKSKTKIKRMAKYYPEIVLLVVGKEEYKPIKRLKRMFPEAIKCDLNKANRPLKPEN